MVPEYFEIYLSSYPIIMCMPFDIRIAKYDKAAPLENSPALSIAFDVS